ncbi:ABC transporter permease [Candidatus Bathyarchaeota archaeon]|nr:ABC transporter permease [Candidatus Bathyarchaeota archaeon]
MKLLDITVLSAEGLRERKFRVALNVLGILVGCAAVTGLISLADGMNTQVKDQLSMIGTNTLFVLPGESEEAAKSMSATGILESAGLTWRDRETISNIRGVYQTCELSTDSGAFEFRGETYRTKVMGVGWTFLQINKDIELSEGRFFKSGDKAVCIIGKNIAQPPDEDEPIIGSGDRIKLQVTVAGEAKEMTLRVVGVLAEHGSIFGLNADDIIGVPFRTFDQLYETGGSTSIVQAYVKDADDIDDVEQSLKDRLGDDYIIVSPNSAINVMKEVTGTIQAVLGGIAAISLFVAGLGIVNTMAVSVNERTREIGTMKAIGAKSVDILLLFLSEAVYTGLIGGVVGSTLGFTMGKIAGQFIGLPVGHSLPLAFAVIAFALVTSVLSGAGPAYRASKMDPVKALRQE